MTKHFSNINNLEELRREYKRLLKHFHPDQPCGSEEIMKEINTEYETLFNRLKNIHEATNEEERTNEDFSKAYDATFREILNNIISYNIDIEIIGSWIWLSGNTFEVKEAIKALGFRWISKRKQWAWHMGDYKKCNSKQKSMDELRNIYGSSFVKKSACVKSLTAC